MHLEMRTHSQVMVLKVVLQSDLINCLHLNMMNEYMVVRVQVLVVLVVQSKIMKRQDKKKNQKIMMV